MCACSILGNSRNLWYFLFPTPNLFVILNICSSILIESLGSGFDARQSLEPCNKSHVSLHADCRAPVPY